MIAKNKNKEADRFSSAGSSAVYKAERLRVAIAEAMKEDGMKEAVMEYIFSGDSDAVSPLEEIRKANK
jgi:hypothetical protein